MQPAESRTAALRRLVSELGIGGAVADSVLPEPSVMYRHVQLGPMASDEVRVAMRWQGATALDLDEGDVVCESVALDISERDHFLAAASRHDLEAHRNYLRECGLAVGRIDAAPLALCHGFAASLVMCVDLIAERPALLVSRFGNLVFYRGLDEGSCEGGRVSDDLWHQVEQCRHFLGERMDFRDAKLCVLESGDECNALKPGGTKVYDWRELVPREARGITQEADARDAYLALIAFGLVWDGQFQSEESHATRSAA